MKLWAIESKTAPGRYLIDIVLDFTPMHPLCLYASRQDAERKQRDYLTPAEAAQTRIVEYDLTRVDDGQAHTNDER